VQPVPKQGPRTGTIKNLTHYVVDEGRWCGKHGDICAVATRRCLVRCVETTMKISRDGTGWDVPARPPVRLELMSPDLSTLQGAMSHESPESKCRHRRVHTPVSSEGNKTFWKTREGRRGLRRHFRPSGSGCRFWGAHLLWIPRYLSCRIESNKSRLTLHSDNLAVYDKQKGNCVTQKARDDRVSRGCKDDFYRELWQCRVGEFGT